MIKSRMSGIRFKVAIEDDVTVGDIVDQLGANAFKEAGSDATKAYGFSCVDSPWEVPSFTEENTVPTNSVVTVFFRVDKRTPEKSAVDRKVYSLLKKQGKDSFKGMKRAEKKEIEEEAKSLILMYTPWKTSFIPVVFDYTSGEGVFFSTSCFDEFSELFSNVVRSPVFHVDTQFIIDEKYPDDNLSSVSDNFLTWFWWRTESNPMKQAISKSEVGYEVSIGDSVSVYGADGEKVTSKNSDLSEARLALSSGFKLGKAAFSLVSGGGNTTDVVFDNSFTLSGVKTVFSDSSLSESMKLYEAYLFFTEIFSIFDNIFDDFVKNCAFGDPLPATVVRTWGRGTICSREMEDF